MAAVKDTYHDVLIIHEKFRTVIDNQWEMGECECTYAYRGRGQNLRKSVQTYYVNGTFSV